MKASDLGEMRISFFKNIRASKTPYSNDITIKQFISYTNNKLDEYCDILKHEEKHSERYDFVKSQCLPCATISCVCDYRDSKHVLVRNPLLVIDIDYDPDKGHNLWLMDEKLKEEKKQLIFSLPYVYMIKESCSGKGLYGIVLLDSNENDKDLLEHFLSLEKELKEHDIIIDEACKDVVRLRIISASTALIKDGDIVAYTGRIKSDTEEINDKINKIKVRHEFKNRRTFGMPTKEEIMVELIGMIIDKGYQTNSYNEWLRDMFLLKPFGVLGEELMCDISRNSLGFTTSDAVINKMKTINNVHIKEDAYKYYFGIAKSFIGDDYYKLARQNIRNKK